MINWRKVPFIRILIPFIAGIVFASRDTTDLLYQPLLLFCSFFICWIALLFSPVFYKKWIAGILTQVCLFSLGAYFSYQYNTPDPNIHYQTQYKTGDWIIGTINEQPKTGKNLRFSIKVSQVGSDEKQLHTAKGLLMVDLPLSPKSKELAYGDLIVLKAPIKSIEAPKNPMSFDYRQYLARKQIYFQVRPKEAEWAKLASNQGQPMLGVFLRMRDQCLAVFRKHLRTANELAIASALILGDKSEIGEELRNAYAETGALHVLAVSGLHVGFVALGLGWLLGLFRSYRKAWKILKTILILLGVWTFALITGASPSVLRAASMFSLLIIGQSLQRYSSIYNTLAASAFCLLLLNPNLLFEAGFQLSYLAVTGIVFFYPRIYRSWIIDHPIGDFLWKMVAVSLAAQLTTFPLSLYYFHQFPIYFWLSGIIVVPAAMIILPLGILLLLAEWLLPVLAVLLGKLLYGVIWLSTSLIFLLHQLPGGLIEGIWISAWTLFLLYLLIAILMIGLERERPRYFLYIATIALFLTISSAYHRINSYSQKKIIVYHIHRNSLVDLFDGQNTLSISGEELEEGKEKFAAENFRNAMGITAIKKTSFSNEEHRTNHYLFTDRVLQFDKTRWAFIDGIEASNTSSLQVDFLLLRNNPRLAISEVLKTYQFKTLIIDASNSRHRREQWKKECTLLQLPYHDIAEDGAFTLDLNHLQ